MRTTLLLITTLLLGATTRSAGAFEPSWSLSTCPADADQRAAALARSIKAAKPGQEGYLPHPYPTDDAQAVQDFTHQFLESWGQRSLDETPAQERHIVGLLRRNALRYEVLPVAEWRPVRCGRLHGRSDRLLLLRVFTANGGAEVMRATLHESGLLATVTLPLAGRPGMEMTDGHGLRPLAEVASRAQRSGRAPQGLQYVALSSPTLACYEHAPCAVYQHGDQVYLDRSGQLFEVRRGRALSVAALTREGVERQAVVSAQGPGQHLLTLGGDAMTVATPAQ